MSGTSLEGGKGESREATRGPGQGSRDWGTGGSARMIVTHPLSRIKELGLRNFRKLHKVTYLVTGIFRHKASQTPIFVLFPCFVFLFKDKELVKFLLYKISEVYYTLGKK